MESFAVRVFLLICISFPFYFPLICYIPTSFPSLHFFLTPNSPLPLINFSSVSLQKWAGIPGITTEHGMANYNRQATIPHIRVERGNTVGKKRFQKSQRCPPPSTVWSSTGTPVHMTITYIQSPYLKPIQSPQLSRQFLWWSITLPQLILCSRFSQGSCPLWSLQSICIYSVGISCCRQVFGCVSLYLVPYVAGWCLSDDY